MLRRSTLIASSLFAGAGVMHFARPDFFEAIVPEWFPDPRLANRASGAAEIVLGVGLLPAATRRRAALGLAVLTVAVFPANVDMAVNDVEILPESTADGTRMRRSRGTARGARRVANWLRLPLQLPLLWWMVREARAAR